MDSILSKFHQNNNDLLTSEKVYLSRRKSRYRMLLPNYRFSDAEIIIIFLDTKSLVVFYTNRFINHVEISMTIFDRICLRQEYSLFQSSYFSLICYFQHQTMNKLKTKKNILNDIYLCIDLQNVS